MSHAEKAIERWRDRCTRAVVSGTGLPKRGWIWKREIPGYRDELSWISLQVEFALLGRGGGLLTVDSKLRDLMREARTDLEFQVRLLAYAWLREELARDGGEA